MDRIVEAKDTVIKKGWMNKEVQEDQDRLLLQQAEISFKAGQESRCDWHKPLPQIISESFTEGKKVGIKEVVEWIEKHIRIYYWDDVNAWQNQKKEWGIDG